MANMTPVDVEKVSESQPMPSEKNQYRVDGGVDAWTVIAGASVALFVQFGLGEHASPLCFAKATYSAKKKTPTGNSYGTFQQFVRPISHQVSHIYLFYS
jgi:hypothetical protein